MNDKYVKLADVKRKLRYIFKAYGVGGFVKEKVEKTLGNLPYSVKGDLETTLEATDVQPLKHGRWKSSANAIESGTVKCSNCRSEMYIDDLLAVSASNDNLPNYCPNCGARMDGGDKDDS